MAANEGSGFDLTVAADAGSLMLELVVVAVIAIPLLALTVLLVSRRRAGHRRAPEASTAFCSGTTTGTRYLAGEINRSEYHRAVATSRRS